MVIGDHLSPDQKLAFIRARIKPGTVVRLFSKRTNPPKDKYLLIAATDPYMVLFYINSRINPFITTRPKLAAQQVTIRAAEHKFLNYDSFIGCHEVEYFPVEDIEGQLLSDMSRLCGTLDAAAKADVVIAVRASVTLTKLEIKAILDSLGGN